MTPKRLSIAALTTAVAVVIVIGLSELHGSAGASKPLGLTAAQMQQQLAGSPEPLASIHAQASELLPGGLPAIRARLASLHGTPVVINKWASWCQPCRAEFGLFQRVSLSLGRRVAFLGIDSGDVEDGRSKPEAFLRSYPLSYPSYYDESGQAGLTITKSGFTPVTMFIDAAGRYFIRQGQYPTVAKLEADVRRYALDG